MRGSTLAALIVLTLASLGLRLHGNDAGLPMEVEPDCKIPYQVEVLREGDEAARSEADYLWYPLLIARLASVMPVAEAPAPDAPLADHLAAAAPYNRNTRLLVALLAVLAVPATFALARLFLDEGWALFAAALQATSLLAINFSQQSRPHAPSAALFLLAVLAAVRVRRRGELRDHVLLGVAGFCALGCLQSGLAVLPAMLAAYLLREPGGPRRRLDPLALVAFAITLAAIPMLLPASGTEAEGGLRYADGILHVSGHQIFLSQFNGQGFGILLDALVSFEPALLALTALGALVVLVPRARTAALGERRPGSGRDLLVVLAFALPYLLVTGLYERNYERFVLPLLPYFACLAALGVAGLVRAIAPRAGAGVGVAVAALVLALPTYAALRLSAIRGAPTTIDRAADWVRAHVAPGERVLLFPEIDLPLLRRDEGLVFWGARTVGRRFAFLPWARYQAERDVRPAAEPEFDLVWSDLGRFLAEPRAYLEVEQCDLVLLEVFAQNRTSVAATRAREELQRTCDLLVRISPDGDRDGSDHPLGFQNETTPTVHNPNFTARVLRAEGTGPVLEVYRPRPQDG